MIFLQILSGIFFAISFGCNAFTNRYNVRAQQIEIEGKKKETFEEKGILYWRIGFWVALISGFGTLTVNQVIASNSSNKATERYESLKKIQIP